jgi:glycosidase
MHKNIYLKLRFKNENLKIDNLAKYEFHISNYVRQKYNLEEDLFSITGNVVFANFREVKEFTHKINSQKKSDFIQASQLNAMGLLDEIYHFIFRVYETKYNPNVFQKAINYLKKEVNERTLENVLLDFIVKFPPKEVYTNKKTPIEYLYSQNNNKSNFETTLEELILYFFSNFNPANKQFKEFFDENYLSTIEDYKKVINLSEIFFENEKPFEDFNLPIFTLLKLPIINAPNCLEDQLKYIKENFAVILDPVFLEKILTGIDFIREEVRFGFGGGPGDTPTVVPLYGKGQNVKLSLGKSGYTYTDDEFKDYLAPEQFTSDRDWMPTVVMLAKNTYVWLDQLSKKYGRHIKYLSDVPDEELDLIRSWNINALWLIGLWERSYASQRIKHILGNIDAVASAYSLYDYVIAADLGGEEAFQNLDYRCKIRGIRLASDMVPNHVGLISKWVIEHPDYFIQSSYPPYPNYRFTGENLSNHPDIEVRIEDGYWTKSDAAVVFQRIDRRTGEVRYIYHGNDGTMMPWNDTAQLNLLKPEVREALIQTIMHVARKTSIIRFDAAMTLTKKHYQRLWFPKPGHGGDIPSRSEFAMTQEEFDAAMPNEFWREVVDRMNAEMPNTLLLAEAFWLMEGYFVRTLGMHRVYNSAFMNMLKKEENDKYRDLISNTLEFNPEILKRYVNFMSNPDEETAIRQFGSDGKYFGVCMMMATLPGLPMIGHGQIEGFHEKYGMEYKRAYYNEQPNQWLIDRHKREIFPVFAKRYIFSEVYNFWFFDFYDGFGNINENVFAYFNEARNEKALFVYNNKFAEAKGWINYSTQKMVQLPDGTRQLQTRKLADLLNCKNDDKHFYIFREHVSGLEFIRKGSEVHKHGLYFELGAFNYQLFWQFKEVYDQDGKYQQIYDHLNGRGTYDIEIEIRRTKLKPIHDSFLSLFDQPALDLLDKYIHADENETKTLKQFSFKYNLFINTICEHYNFKLPIKVLNNNIKDYELVATSIKYLYNLMNDNALLNKYPWLKYFKQHVGIFDGDKPTLYVLFSYITMLRIIELFSSVEIDLFEELELSYPLENLYKNLGFDENYTVDRINLILIIAKYFRTLYQTKENKLSFNWENFIKMLESKEVKVYLKVHEYQNEYYFSKESYEELLNWILLRGFIKISRNYYEDDKFNSVLILDNLKLVYQEIDNLIDMPVSFNYKYENLLDKIKQKYLNKKIVKEELANENKKNKKD